MQQLNPNILSDLFACACHHPAATYTLLILAFGLILFAVAFDPTSNHYNSRN